MKIFDLNNINLYILMVLAVVNSIMLCFVAGKLFQIMQLSGYKIAGYNAWLKDTKTKYIGRLFMLSFLSLFSILVTNALLDGFGIYYTYLGLFFYFYFCIIFTINISKIPQKTPLKQTRRMNRLIFTTSIIMIGISFIIMALSTEFIPFIRYGVIVITPLCLPIIVPFANMLNLPLESFIRSGYIKRAKIKLKKMPSLIKIGITGSFGKTTTKHILNVMLSKKYSVCMTPHSFNTPMGLTKVVLKYLRRSDEVLIAEMGAKHVGDIKYLCNLIAPQHAVITAVGSQHLLTFGSVANIAKTKYELVDAIEDGYIVFNGSNSGALSLYEKCDKNKILTGIEKKEAFCNITNIKVSSSGSTFTLNIENNKIECNTKLLGMANIEDIAMSAALAYKLGVSVEDIASSIKELEPMPHRLELISGKNGVNIIDNSYNSSVESSKIALATLNLFDTGKKIIVTPGMVEMGNMEHDVNVEFGRNIAKVCDKVILVNKVNAEAIKEGLKAENFDEGNIFECESLKTASELFAKIATSGDTILFENDLPDNYT